VCPRRGDDGEERFPHPLWDEMPTDPALTVLREPAGAHPPTRSVQPRRPPEPRRTWRATQPIRRRDHESASSLETLVGCSFQYTLSKISHIERGLSQSPLFGVQMLGNLAHAVLDRVVKLGVRDPDAAHAAALRELDALVPTTAAFLALPAAEAERTRTRLTVAAAARTVITLLAAHDAEVAGTEEELHARELDVDLEGRIDLRLAKPNVVIDYKWSGRTSKIDALKEGAAVQLAVYAKLVSTRGAWPGVGYFLVDGQELLTAEDLHGARRVAAVAPDITWDALAATYRARRAELDAGEVFAVANADAAGVITPKESGLAGGRVALVPKCRYCELPSLCGRLYTADEP
jgi:ATP-dependent helicase/nuclease subunit B